MPLPEINQENFGIIKVSGFVICFLVGAALQLIFPYKRMNGQIFQNWRVNLPLSLINTAFFSLFCASCACALSLQMESLGYGFFNSLAIPQWVELLFGLLLLDFTAYAWHRLNHKIAFLWRFHSVHHSDRVFEASTALRFHLGELLFSLGVRLAMVSVFGLSVAAILFFELVFQFFNIVIHGNIRVAAGLERFVSLAFITPAHHRKHHSLNPAETNSNFGTIFLFWDQIGLSHRPSQSSEKIEVGLVQTEGRTLLQTLLIPFRR